MIVLSILYEFPREGKLRLAGQPKKTAASFATGEEMQKILDAPVGCAFEREGLEIMRRFSKSYPIPCVAVNCHDEK
jgi:hypothetical protein